MADLSLLIAITEQVIEEMTVPTPNIVDGRIYPTVMIPCGGDKKLRSFHRLFCMQAGCRESLLLSPGARGQLSITGVIGIAKKKGWYADKKGYALCMDHAPGSRSRPPSKMPPAQKRAAFNRIKQDNIAKAMREKEPRVSVPTTIIIPEEEPAMATTAEQPRVATREDKRRIRDTLDSLYDEENQRYSKNWTDESVAVKLNVPRAWVTDLRDNLYGPDVNEAGQAKSKELMALLAVASKLKDDALGIATRAEELEKACRKALD